MWRELLAFCERGGGEGEVEDPFHPDKMCVEERDAMRNFRGG
jgi:hypothetical protein